MTRALIGTVLLICFHPSVLLSAVQALFDLNAPSGGPFPSDRYTVADCTQNTGRRLHIPLPNCEVQRSDCEDLTVLNTLDGFSVLPRLAIPFDGSIDITTVSSSSIVLIALQRPRECMEASMYLCGDDSCGAGSPRSSTGRVVGINRIEWDVATNVLYAESDELLEQHAQYALIVTRGVHAADGTAVEPSNAFREFRQSVRGAYKLALLDAVRAARHAGIAEEDIVTASVFTTQSVTSLLEKIREQIKAVRPSTADFRLPNGERTVFPAASITSIALQQQTGADPVKFTAQNVNTALLQLIPGTVGAIAYGQYQSPDYEVHPGEFIAPVATRSGVPVANGRNTIAFNLFLPSSAKPQQGWPVAIFGHGNGQDKNLAFNVAASMAARGIATIAINAVGHGGGPLSTTTVRLTDGTVVTFPAGGRGLDQNGDHTIDTNEGIASAAPRTILYRTDGIRQTVVDLMQLVRVIETGVDVDGNGTPDLDASRISYFGHSQGSMIGVVFAAIEPALKVVASTSGGGPLFEANRLAPTSRAILGRALAARIPSLINAPGVTSIERVAASAPFFNENLPLRAGAQLRVQLADGTSSVLQSPVINRVAGAVAIQELLANTKWVGMSADALAFAPYLRRTPLAGVPEKSVLVQFGKGDMQVPNPAATAFVRAGEIEDRVTFYRNDLALTDNPALLKNPHGFMVRSDTAFKPIALAAQKQIAMFFESDGTVTIHPDAEHPAYFEVPVVAPLPEELSFIP